MANYLKRRCDTANCTIFIYRPYAEQGGWGVNDDFKQLDSLAKTGVLGKGQFGTVSRCIYRGEQAAIKEAQIDPNATPDANQAAKADFEREALLTQKISSVCDTTHLMRAIDVGRHNGNLAIVSEEATMGALNSILHVNPLPPARHCNYIGQIASGLRSLHEHGILHRDLAARNVLMCEAERLVIGDFGMSREGSDYAMQPGEQHPLRWSSPGSLLSRVSTTHSDLWQFAVTMSEISKRGLTPFLDDNNAEVITAVKSGKFEYSPNDDIRLVQEILYKVCVANEAAQGLVASITDVSVANDKKIAPACFELSPPAQNMLRNWGFDPNALTEVSSTALLSSVENYMVELEQTYKLQTSNDASPLVRSSSSSIVEGDLSDYQSTEGLSKVIEAHFNEPTDEPLPQGNPPTGRARGYAQSSEIQSELNQSKERSWNRTSPSETGSRSEGLLSRPEAPVPSQSDQNSWKSASPSPSVTQSHSEGMLSSTNASEPSTSEAPAATNGKGLQQKMREQQQEAQKRAKQGRGRTNARARQEPPQTPPRKPST